MLGPGLYPYNRPLRRDPLRRRRTYAAALAVSAMVLLLVAVVYRAEDDSRRRATNRALVSRAARRLGMPQALALAVAEAESAFNHRAVSPKGAVGLMQVMPDTARGVARRLGLRSYDLYDPEDNVLLGITYLREMLNRYGGDLHLALAAYNAGPKRVDAWRKRASRGASGSAVVSRHGYRETRRYVKRVLAARKRYAAGSRRR
ncbi:MAG: lytic transglycosylase domain-containing protein [Planctomycetota bacterium]|jgi:soluble lytic murein transglycosylase-like protein